MKWNKEGWQNLALIFLLAEQKRGLTAALPELSGLVINVPRGFNRSCGGFIFSPGRTWILSDYFIVAEHMAAGLAVALR